MDGIVGPADKGQGQKCDFMILHSILSELIGIVCLMFGPEQ
jgi:hypothetical protein